MSLSVSVALCTHNGAAHLQEQLDSLLHQWRPPNEVVLRDDGSSDQTLYLLQEFAKRAPFEVRLYTNNVHLGPSQNYAAAMTLCRGEVIAFCNQDEIWHPGKLTRIVRPFERENGLGLVFHDAQLIDEQGGTVGSSLWRRIGLSPLDRFRFAHQPLSVLLGHNMGRGGTMAFRRDLLSWANRPPEGWRQDSWLALMGVILFPCKLIDQRLTFARLSEATQSPAADGGYAAADGGYAAADGGYAAADGGYAAGVSAYEAAASRLAALPDRPMIRNSRRKINKLLEHLRLRAMLPGDPLSRFWTTLPHFLHLDYHRYARGLRSWAEDLSK